MGNSLYIAVSGMSAFSSQIAACSNNIANIETTGYKASSVSFSDMLAESIYRTGGSNEGCGVQIQSVSENWTQGTISKASSTASLAINGYGMFTVRNPDTGQKYYTRDGSFEFDKNGRLVYDDKLVVQGYALDKNGNKGSLTDITVSLEAAAPKQTSEFTTTLNLNSSADSGATFENTIDVYDSLGNTITVTIDYTKSTTSNEWTWTASIPSADGTIGSGGSGTLAFDSNGALTSGTNPSLTLNLINGAGSQTVTWDMYDSSGNTNGKITQYASDSALTAHTQDGYAAGELTSLDIDKTGKVVCTYSNGTTSNPFQIALADFANYNGLNKLDGNLYSATSSSGQAVMGAAGEGKMGSVSSCSLEGSNVDLSSEMTQLITAQTAYQACSKAFSTTNEILQVLVNLKS